MSQSLEDEVAAVRGALQAGQGGWVLMESLQPTCEQPALDDY